MAIKYSDVINLLRTDYKGVIRASDPDFAGFCTNAQRSKAFGVLSLSVSNMLNIKLSGVNSINFNSINKNWQMLYPFQGTIHFYIIKKSTQQNNEIRFAWNTLFKYCKREEIPIKENGFSIYMNYFYADPSTPNFDFWGDDILFTTNDTYVLPKKNTWHNGNVKFTDLKTNENGFGKNLFFAAKIPYDIQNGWSTGVGFIFKDIHKSMDFFKRYVGINKPSRYNFNTWTTHIEPFSHRVWAYNIDMIDNIGFYSHDRNDYEEINLDNVYVDLK
jgi:hypothetical protein